MSVSKHPGLSTARRLPALPSTQSEAAKAKSNHGARELLGLILLRSSKKRFYVALEKGTG